MYIMKPECNLTITRVIRRYTHTQSEQPTGQRELKMSVSGNTLWIY